jgi:hypothetical protein
VKSSARFQSANNQHASRFSFYRTDGRTGPGTWDWLKSDIGRFYLTQHNLTQAPTLLLSLECQKRKFNPAFEVKVISERKYRCVVTVRDLAITCTGTYDNQIAAKQDAAYKALQVVREWPLPTALFFIGQFTGHVSDATVHDKIQQVLQGRRYKLSTQRFPGMPGGYLLLQIPDQGWPTSFIRLDGGPNSTLTSVVLTALNKDTNCNLCRQTSMHPHARVDCPLWVLSPAPLVTTQHRIEPYYGGHKSDLALRPIKQETKEQNLQNCNRDAAKYGDNTADKQTQLLRGIQQVVGTAAASSESQDPKVKAAFLEGIALGARLAATAPGNPNNRDRQRTRSPGGREPRGSDYWPPPSYRARSPIAPRRGRQRSRDPMLWDASAEPRHPAQTPVGSARVREWSPHGYGQGASHWDNGKHYR